jgi:hypothetical protein
MSPPKAAHTTTEIYDQALKYCRDFRLQPGTPRPGYTSTWLEENIAVLERYREWLSGGDPHLPHPHGRARPLVEPQAFEGA